MAENLEKGTIFSTPCAEIPCLPQGLLFKQQLAIGQILWRTPPGAVLSSGAVYYAVQGVPNFWDCEWNPKVWPFKHESYWAVFFYDTIYYAVQGGSNFCVCPSKWTLPSSHFLQGLQVFGTVKTTKFLLSISILET